MSESKSKSSTNTAIWVAVITGSCTLIGTVLTIVGGPIVQEWLENQPKPPEVVQPSAVPISPTQTPRVGNELFVEDNLEGVNPDFLTLVVKYDDKTVSITIALGGAEILDGSNFIYMYGTYHDLIRLNANGFSLERDFDKNGHFEDLIFSGSYTRLFGSSIGIDIPIEYIPDIPIKEIWGYSMQSKDSIPDNGKLVFPTPSP